MLGEIELRGNRLFLHHGLNNCKVEIDITPVWNFFEEVSNYMKQPLGVVEEVKEEVKKKYAQIGGKLYEITAIHVIMPEYKVPQYQDIKKVELFVTGLE